MRVAICVACSHDFALLLAGVEVHCWVATLVAVWCRQAPFAQKRPHLTVTNVEIMHCKQRTASTPPSVQHNAAVRLTQMVVPCLAGQAPALSNNACLPVTATKVTCLHSCPVVSDTQGPGCSCQALLLRTTAVQTCQVQGRAAPLLLHMISTQQHHNSVPF